MQVNQTSVTGPKMAPTPAVPRRCTRNRPTMMPRDSQSTSGSSVGAATVSPSTALRTEIAGVMIPSP